MKRFVVAVKERAGMFLLAILIVAADQLLKLMVGRCPAGYVVFRCAPLFEIVRTANPGAAFSILSGKTLLLLVATTAMLFALIFAIAAYPALSRKARWCLAVLLGGGVGNWIDRFFSGSVTDYIRLLFIRFPVFNLADICITLSVMCMIMLVAANRFESHTGEKHGTGH